MNFSRSGFEWDSLEAHHSLCLRCAKISGLTVNHCATAPPLPATLNRGRTAGTPAVVPLMGHTRSIHGAYTGRQQGTQGACRRRLFWTRFPMAKVCSQTQDYSDSYFSVQKLR